MKPNDYGPFPYSPIINRPRLSWPADARVALWVIPNIEFFSLEERPGGYGGAESVPDVMMWSERDYGNRVGVWRLMEVLDRYGIRATVALNSLVCVTIRSSSRKAISVAGSGWGTMKPIPAASMRRRRARKR